MQNMLIFQYFFNKTFFDPHICIETFEKGLGFLLKVMQELTFAQRIPKVQEDFKFILP